MEKIKSVFRRAWLRLLEKLRKWAPPGANVESELGWDIFLFVMSLCCFWFIFESHLAFMVTERVSDSGEMVLWCRSLMWVMRNSCIFLIIVLIRGFRCIRRHYRSFSEGSMSIYTMKRISDAMEIHRRCIVLPAVFMGLCLLFAAVNVLWGAAIYRANIPKLCVMEEWKSFTVWRLILCL